MTRICIIAHLVIWIERFLIGSIPNEAGLFAYYVTAFFVLVSVVRTYSRSLFQGPTPDLEVHKESGILRREQCVEWAACGMRGWRPDMEDSHVVEMLDASVFPDAALFGVLDGHGGWQVSALAAQLLAQQVVAAAREQPKGSKSDWKPSLAEALEKAVPALDARMRTGAFGLGRLLHGPLHPFYHEGSTACVAAVDFARQEIVVANLGDSRGILIRDGKAIDLSVDHKPEDVQERRRIENAGGRVIKVGPCWRVDGNLNLSRALGDFHLKAHPVLPPEKQKVSSFPDLTRTPYNDGPYPQEILVMGCDGLFEKKSNQDIADIVWPRFLKGMALDKIGEEVLHACCAKSFRGQPVEMGTDNETVVIVKLPPRKGDAAPAPQNGNSFAAGERVRVDGLTAQDSTNLRPSHGAGDPD